MSDTKGFSSLPRLSIYRNNIPGVTHRRGLKAKVINLPLCTLPSPKMGRAPRFRKGESVSGFFAFGLRGQSSPPIPNLVAMNENNYVSSQFHPPAKSLTEMRSFHRLLPDANCGRCKYESSASATILIDCAFPCTRNPDDSILSPALFNLTMPFAIHRSADGRSSGPGL